jgi:putative inorganic carbon (HCO3(-)) transporter
MLLAIGIALLILGEVVIFCSEVGGVYWYWAWFLIRPQETWLGLGDPIPMERIFAITLIVCTYYRFRVSRQRPVVVSKPIKMFAILVLVNFLTVLTAVWRGNSWDVSVQFLKLFAFFFVASIVLDTPERVRNFIWVYAIGVGWEAFSAVKNYYTNPYFAQGIQRAEGSTATWSDPNATAFNLVFALPIILALLLSSEKWKLKLALLGITGMAVVALILTGSRAGFLSLIILFVLMTLRSKRRMVLIPALILASIVGWTLTPAEYQQRYATILGFAEDPTANLDTSQGESAYGRIVGFRVAMMIFADHPILGVGVGNFPFAWKFGPYTFHGFKGWHQPHNLPGEILSEQGIVGGIAFAAFLIAAFRCNAMGMRILQSLNEPPPILANLGKMVPVVLICMIISSFSSHSYYRYNWYLMCLIAGALVQMPEKLKEEESDRKEKESRSPKRRIEAGPRVGRVAALSRP